MPEKLVSHDGPRLYRAAARPRPWGDEITFTWHEEQLVGRVLHIDAGHSLSQPSPGNLRETFFLLSGLARLEYGVQSAPLHAVAFHAGDVLRLPPGSVYRLEASENVTLVECAVSLAH